MTETTRRVLLLEITTPKGRWSSSATEQVLREYLPDECEPVLWGEISGIDPAYRKLRQLSRETEDDASKSDRVHSAHKALSFFRDMFPTAFWKWKLIGEGREPGVKVAGR